MATNLYQLNVGMQQHPTNGKLIYAGETFLVDSSLIPASWTGPPALVTIVTQTPATLGLFGDGTYSWGATQGLGRRSTTKYFGEP